jgi:Protein of unknown function (DUF1761)
MNSLLRPLPILLAALAVYATGFVIYGLLVPPETWMAWAGIPPAEMAALGTSRMIFSPAMPLLIATGTAAVLTWRGSRGALPGALTGLALAFFFLVGGRLYGYVYGVEGLNILLLDSAHLLLNGLAAGAVLGAWAGRGR